MMRSGVFFLGLLNATIAMACEPTQVEEVAPGLWVRPGHHHVVFAGDDLANIGFIIGKRCVAVIDTGGSPDEGEALRCALRERSNLPICYVINTHVHPDHLFGNQAFVADNPLFIGHRNLPRSLAARAPFYLQNLQEIGIAAGSDWLVQPEQTVNDSLTLDLGERVLEVTAHPTAHSDTDLSIYDPQTATLWLSDLLFMDHVPVVEGSLLGWLEVLTALQSHPAERVIPGHGPVSAAWPQAASQLQHYLTSLRDQIRQLLNKGGSLEEALTTIGREQANDWQLFTDYHPRNITTAYTELEWED